MENLNSFIFPPQSSSELPDHGFGVTTVSPLLDGRPSRLFQDNDNFSVLPARTSSPSVTMGFLAQSANASRSTSVGSFRTSASVCLSRSQEVLMMTMSFLHAIRMHIPIHPSPALMHQLIQHLQVYNTSKTAQIYVCICTILELAELLISPLSVHEENMQLREENAALRAENETLKCVLLHISFLRLSQWDKSCDAYDSCEICGGAMD